MNHAGKQGWEDGGISRLFPAADRLHWILRKQLRIPYSEERINKMQKLTPGQQRENLEMQCDRQMFSYLILIGAVTLLIVVIAAVGEVGGSALKKSAYLIRAEPGKGSQTVEIEADAGSAKKTWSITVPERQYRPEELQAKMEEAKQYIRTHYLGKNDTAQRVTRSLYLVSEIPDSAVRIRWRLDGAGYINQDGSLNNDTLSGETEVHITAILIYEDTREKMVLSLLLYPREKSAQEKFWDTWEESWEQEKQETATDKILKLPESVGKIKLRYQEVTHPIWLKFLAGGIFLCILCPFLLDYQTEQGIRKREAQMQREYPEMMERFILLLGAGLTIRGVWWRMTEDYEKRREKGGIAVNYLYEEMLLTRYEMENGKSEGAAYADFGRRVSLLPYMKFSALLVQNLKKGSDDLLRRMDLEAADALRTRRDFAKRMGEEAGTRLLLPMMMMLVIVFALILAAAFQSM